MTNSNKSENSVIMLFNLAGVIIALGMLGMSLWLSTEVPLSTKGFWGIGVLMLCTGLVNFVKYRFDERLSDDRIERLEAAKNEKLLSDYVGDV